MIKKGKTRPTCTASARRFTPFNIAALPSTPNFICFPPIDLVAPIASAAILEVMLDFLEKDCNILFVFE